VLNNYERVGDVLPEIPNNRSGVAVSPRVTTSSRISGQWPQEDPWADLPDSVLSDMLDRIEADLAAAAARTENSAPELPGSIAVENNDASQEQHVAATKIAAVASGFLTRHRLGSIS